MKYKVDFINRSYRRQFEKHGEEYLAAIAKAAARGDFVLRRDVAEFERRLAKYVGTKYAVAVNSGTDALFLSLRALGVGTGDEVITVGHTFIASLQVIIHCGAIPILVDVGEDALMDVSQIEAVITPRTKVILPVHLSGKVCDMTEIMRLADKYDIAVVEDACQALGAKWKGKMAGAIGDTGCFSFISPKLMGAWGDNGAVVTDRKDLFERLQLLRNHWNITQGALHGHQYEQPKEWEWAWNSRMDNIQAAILNKKFKYLPWILRRRKQICQKYYKSFKSLESEDFKLPTVQPEQVWQEFILRIKDKQKFMEHMSKRKVELLIRDTTPNHKLRGLGLDHFDLPMTEKMAVEAVRLPTYPELTNEEVDYVIESVKSFFRQGATTGQKVISNFRPDRDGA